ncbi:MAG: hypothetical protein ACI33K_07450 [Clostridiaceae bacterium]
MAKHKGRKEESKPSQGMDTSQLMSMLGNVDLNQLSSVLGAMGNDGFNINNVNTGGSNKNNRGEQGSRVNDKDNTVQMLRSLRGFVSPQKVKIIDKIIEMYLSGEFDD